MRHVEVAQKSDKVSLTCVVEPIEARRAELTAMGLTAVATLDDAPAETAAAISATPTQVHFASATGTLSRGWPTLVEKPITGTLADAQTLLQTAEKAGLPLITGHHRRCHPFSITARNLLMEIGLIVAIQGLWSLRKHANYYDTPWRTQPGAGVLMTNLSHELDLIRYLVGEIGAVQAMTSNHQRQLQVEDTAAINLVFQNGAMGQFLMSDAGASPWSFETATAENPAIAPSGQDYLRIVGTEGALAFPSLTLCGRSDDGEIEWSKPLTQHTPLTFEKIDPLLAQIDRFADLIAGNEDDVLCTGADGLAALEWTLAAKYSAATQRIIKQGETPLNYTGA